MKSPYSGGIPVKVIDYETFIKEYSKQNKEQNKENTESIKESIYYKYIKNIFTIVEYEGVSKQYKDTVYDIPIDFIKYTISIDKKTLKYDFEKYYKGNLCYDEFIKELSKNVVSLGYKDRIGNVVELAKLKVPFEVLYFKAEADKENSNNPYIIILDNEQNITMYNGLYEEKDIKNIVNTVLNTLHKQEITYATLIDFYKISANISTNLEYGREINKAESRLNNIELYSNVYVLKLYKKE